MRTLPALLLLTACGVSSQVPDASRYDDIDDFKPVARDAGQAPDAGTTGAQFANDGRYATLPTPQRAFCGQTPCDTTQTACCITDGVSAACLPTAQSCTGNVQFACDGPEDCGSGERCCVEPTRVGTSSQVRSVCRAGACTMGPTELCHSAADCPGARPACCAGTDFPLGHCLPMQAAQPGDTCDVAN